MSSRIGHRTRLRKRIMLNGLSGFLDYEVIELLLTLATPRKDCKQIAKQVIHKFGSLKGALEAQPMELQRIKGIGSNNYFGIKLFQELLRRYADEKLQPKTAFYTSDSVGKYLINLIGYEKREHFVLVSLDSRLQLINISKISTGSINSTVVHPREVFKHAIDCLASNIVIAHNHPTNRLDPSPEDIALTRRLVDSANILGIRLLDHIIVSNSAHISLKSLNLL